MVSFLGRVMISGRLSQRRSSVRTAHRRTLLAAVGVASALSHVAIGAEAIWLGGEGNWNDGTRWSTGTRPSDPAVDVIIDGSPHVLSRVLVNDGGNTRNLTIDGGDTLYFEGSAIGPYRLGVGGD